MKNSLPEYFTDHLVNSVRKITLAKGEHLFRTGDKTRGIYFVVSGEMKAVRPMAEESDAIMVRACPGAFFAEAAIAAERYSCDGIAVKPSVLAFVSTSLLNEALKDASFSKDFFLANAMNTRRQCSRYERIRLRGAKNRILHLFACECDAGGIFVWNGPLTELANELALEPETLYRVLAELEKAGKITRDKCRFQIIS